MERFVWIGPMREGGEAGEVARGWVRALLGRGAEVLAVDSRGPGLGRSEARSPDLQPLLDAPVSFRGRTCVFHAAPAEIERLRAFFPAAGATRRVAFILDAALPPPSAETRALQAFDEVWAPGAWAREALAVAGVPRMNLRVLPAGVDLTVFRRQAREPRSRFTFLVPVPAAEPAVVAPVLEAYLEAFARSDPVELVLCDAGSREPGSLRPELVRALSDRVDFFRDDLPRVVFKDGTRRRVDRAAAYAASDLFVAGDPRHVLGLFALEALACGTPVAATAFGGATEFVHDQNALLVGVPEDAARRGEPSLPHLREALRRAFDAPQVLKRLALRGAEEAAVERSAERAATLLLEREVRPYGARPGLLSSILPAFGLSRPEDLVAGSRSRILLCVFDPATSAWREPLGRFLGRHDATDDVTLCLWADAETKDCLASLAAQVTQEIEAVKTTKAPPDVLLMVAPSDHVPWDRVEVRPEFAAEAPAALASA